MRIRSTTIFLALAAAGVLSLSLQSAHAATQDKPHRHTTQAKAPAADEQRLDRDDARYFLTRVGFAPSESELDAYAGLTHREAVDRALAQTGTVATQAPPAWVNDPIIPYNKLPDEDARKAARRTLPALFFLCAGLHRMPAAEEAAKSAKATAFTTRVRRRAGRTQGKNTGQQRHAPPKHH